METKVKPMPEGYHTVNIYIIVNDAVKAIEFYKTAFDAKEIGRLLVPGGKVGHCELQIGDSRIMLADESSENGNKGPHAIGGSPVGICLYLENVDEVFQRAIKAGAKIDRNMDVKNQFYGDRSGSIIDPFGHKWTIATHIEDVSFEELQKRSDEMFSKQPA